MATITDERDHAGGFGVVDPFTRVFAAVSTGLGSVVDATMWGLDDARLSRRLSEALAVQAAADELVARLVGEADERDLGAKVGASSTKAHLVASFRMPRRAAGETVARARGFGAPPSSPAEPAPLGPSAPSRPMSSSAPSTSSHQRSPIRCWSMPKRTWSTTPRR